MYCRIFAVLLFFFAACAHADELPRLGKSENIVFFPAIAQRETDHWKVTINGWIFEPESRRTTAKLLRRYLGVKDADLSVAEKQCFTNRTKLFFIDTISGRKISIQLGNKIYSLGKSGQDGQISGTFLLFDKQMAELSPSTNQAISPLSFRAALRTNDPRTFSGTIEFLEDQGLSIISDIDDTVKISNVTNRKELLRNTFFHPFKPVPEMADIYRSWQTNQQAAFHYISASPRHLYPSLAEFLQASQFPPGTLHLRAWHGRSEIIPHRTPAAQIYKLNVIRPLLKQFPHRHFVLIGDSGEVDPETYGILAREFPQQITKIFIRDISEGKRDEARYTKAFAQIPRETWKVFKNPSEMQLPQNRTTTNPASN